MATLARVFQDESSAMSVAEALMAAGVPDQNIHVLQTASASSATEQRVGTFDDEDANQQRVGTFDNEDASGQSKGSFDDTSVHSHRADDAPKGSFANTDGLPHGPRTMQLDSRHALETRLREIGVDPAIVSGLRADAGTVVVVVDSGSVSADEVQHILGG